MNQELVALALGANRVLTYAGYVLLSGTLVFWSLVWPGGREDRRLVALSATGIALLLVATLAGPGIQMLLGGLLPGDVLGPLTGAGLLVRLAALAAAAFFLADLVSAPVVGWRRVLALALVAVLALTLVVQSDAIGGRWTALKIGATSGHLLATAAWLGGLVALAAVLLPRAKLSELDRLIPRFSVVATVSVITLFVTGAMHALAVAGGMAELVGSRYGLVLLVKLVVFAVMLALGSYGRRYAARVVFRRMHHPGVDRNSDYGAHGLAVVMGAELAIAFAILSTTSLLVMVAPH